MPKMPQFRTLHMKKSPSKDLIKAFPALLLAWDKKENQRKMPWKGEKDPYKIWLSEIILQQTRVEQGLDYYKRFVDAFPTVRDLAQAPPGQVMKLWEGLGYYSRCRNLMEAARYISAVRNGHFPDQYEDILSLKGVGPYTAAAIASFAYNLPHAVVDGNVFRVLARVFGISTPTDTTEGKKRFTRLAEDLLDQRVPGRYNQAIMDFGATVCKPAAPLCGHCVFRDCCKAYRDKKVNALPVKKKKISIRSRHFYYLVLHCRGKWAVRCRTGQDIWRGLYEFPLIESAEPREESFILREGVKKQWIPAKEFRSPRFSPEYRQVLTHQHIRARFLLLNIRRRPPVKDWEWLSPDETGSLAFPRLIRDFMAAEWPG